jgi:hypothetical protein
MLAGYEPMPPKWDGENSTFVPQSPVFDRLPILDSAHNTGRFYYIAYDTSRLADSPLLRQLDHTRVSILTYADAQSFGSFEVICLRRLKEGSDHA